MKDSESNICQIAAVKDGRLVLSETYHDYSKDDCCHIASATKSIVGLSEGYSMNLLPDGHSSCASTQRNVSYNIRLPRLSSSQDAIILEYRGKSSLFNPLSG